MKEITVAALANLRAPLIVDVREPDEFAAGHARGAVSVPLADIENRASEFPADAPVYVICQSGRRSSLAAEALHARQRDVVNVVGGTAAWIEAGLPTSTER